jgi:hypothetical protein
MGTDISPIALELLYSPGFFLVPESSAKADVTVNEHINRPETESADVVMSKTETPAPENLVFILEGSRSLQASEMQMLERMAAFIRNELGVGKDWLKGGPELWQQAQGRHFWVFFGVTALMEELKLFSTCEHERGPILKLPAVEALAPDAVLKKQALEALRLWGKRT